MSISIVGGSPAGVEKRPIQHREVKERALAELSLWDQSRRYGIRPVHP